jgi:NADH-quinone oxidoreductase subunit F
MTPDDIINEVKASNLRRPQRRRLSTGMKWSFRAARLGKAEVRCNVNADESEPGTCEGGLLIQARSASVDRGLSARRARRWRQKGLGLYPASTTLPDPYQWIRRISPRPISTASWVRTIGGTDFSFDLYTHTGAGAYQVR